MKKIILLLLILLVTACSTSPTGRSQLMLISPEQAIASSKQAYIQTIDSLEKKHKVDTDPKVTQRVRRITDRLISQAIIMYPHSAKWEWSVKVIDEDETVNAWCMAGGKMAIYTGLLKKVKPTDDELAQVMGHEIAHALANHSAEKMSVAMASQVGMAALAIAVSDSKYSGAAMTGGALAASVALTLPNSRTAETESDRIGIELAARSGYDPYAAASLWDKMGKVGNSKTVEFLSTHPSPENRKQTLLKLAPKMMKYYKPQSTTRR